MLLLRLGRSNERGYVLLNRSQARTDRSSFEQHCHCRLPHSQKNAEEANTGREEDPTTGQSQIAGSSIRRRRRRRDDAEEGERAELASCVRGDSSVDAVKERLDGVEAVVDADTLAVVDAVSASPEVSGT